MSKHRTLKHLIVASSVLLCGTVWAQQSPADKQAPLGHESVEQQQQEINNVNSVDPTAAGRSQMPPQDDSQRIDRDRKDGTSSNSQNSEPSLEERFERAHPAQ